MFSKKNPGSRDGFDTLVGASTAFEGNIISEGSVRVEGRVKGDLKTSKDVFIGDEAVVEGSIQANNVHLSGRVEGNIHSNGLLRILSTAKLYGDIRIKSFVVDEGALFQGNCSMIDTTEESEKNAVKSSAKKSGRECKKITVLEQVYEEKEREKEKERDKDKDKDKDIKA